MRYYEYHMIKTWSKAYAILFERLKYRYFTV